MPYLEDVLKAYGVIAPYWEDCDHRAADAADHVTALQHHAIAASDGWRDDIQLVDLTVKGLPLFLQLGDIRAQRGSVEAALSAYEAEVRGKNDPARLSELGYLLLQRCRVEELPLCNKDFDGSYIDFDRGETLFISSHMIDFDNPGPAFPKDDALLKIAICAFALAYVRCCEKHFTDVGATWSDRWHELVALDGLRASFYAADDLDGLDSVRGSFGGWVDDYYEGVSGLSAKAAKGLKDLGYTWEQVGDVRLDPDDHFSEYLDPFVTNFNRIGAYLAGRRKAAPSQQSAATLRDIRNLLRSELQPAVGHLRTISDRTEAIHDRMDLMVENLIDLNQRSVLTWDSVREWAEVSPGAEKASAQARLELTLGPTWSRLRPESQQDLIDADAVFAECSRIRSAWRCAAIAMA